MKKFSILKDPVKNNELLETGFVRLSILKNDEIEVLKQYKSQQHEGEILNGLYVSANRLEKDKSQEISDFLLEVLSNKINKIVDKVEILGGTYIIKGAHTIEKLEPHQDWNIVDESDGRSYTLWIALEDTNDLNGALYMLPRSHEKFRGYRHLTIPSIYGKVYEAVWKFMIPVHLKAGEGVLFDHAIGHASMPNLTTKDRIAVTCSLITKNFNYRFYCLKDNTISEYIGQADFYQTEEAKFGPGTLKKIRVLDDAPYQLTKWKLLKNYGWFSGILSYLRMI